MGSKRWWQRTVATVCAAGIAMSMAMVGAGPASATVDPNLPSNNEPDWNPTINGKKVTQVYSFTFQVVHNQPSLTVHGGSMGDGAWVNTWGRYPANSTNYAWATILSPNQLWEFIPDTSNAGTGITDGWGYLRNRQSGKCLELNLTNGGIDQWTCVPGATNELWRAPWNGALQVKYTGPQNASLSYPGTYKTYLGVNTPNGCQGWTANGDGETLYLRESVSECTHITHQKENYRFATGVVMVSPTPYLEHNEGGYTDPDTYRCLNGYHFAFNEGIRPRMDDSIGDIHDAEDLEEVRGVFTVPPYEQGNVYGTWELSNLPENWVKIDYYHGTAPANQPGQVFLTCIPGPSGVEESTVNAGAY